MPGDNYVDDRCPDNRTENRSDSIVIQAEPHIDIFGLHDLDHIDSIAEDTGCGPILGSIPALQVAQRAEECIPIWRRRAKAAVRTRNQREQVG